MPYQSTKQFGHDLGLSCCFRQWRAESHCNQLHGYAIAIRLVFEANELDVRNWVVDFGSLKSLKQMFVDTFDHKLLVAEDDPDKDEICALAGMGIADVIVVPAVGCEKFAEYVFGATEVWLQSNGYAPRVKLISAEVKEHGANSAIYTGE
jgi:6-pyruvoyltetrahydropterin/6-carboxytetrahydropterin synthase